MPVALDPEILRLRTALRDLVALFSVPAVWVDREPVAVAEGIADALFGLSQVDFVFVRLCDLAGSVEATRGNASADFPEWLEHHRLTGAQLPRAQIVPDVGCDGDPCRGLVIPIGVEAEGGLVAAASTRADFPTEIDLLLLSLAANQAATAFQNARLIHDRKRTEEELRRTRDELAREQAGLRQVATLVACESSPRRLFAVVAEQVARIIDVPLVRLVRFEPEGSAVELIGGWGESLDPLAVGTRWHLDGPGVLASVWKSGRPARLDDYTDVPGQAAAVVRQAGMRSAIASPITVEGRLWGAIAVLSPRQEPLPENTEARLAGFTELLATAIADAGSRLVIARLADEQAALRRVATLVARGVRPAEIFSAVSKEVQRLFGLAGETLDVATVVRFDPGPEFILVGAAKSIDGLPLGSRWGPKDLYVSTRVLRTGRSARIDERDLLSARGADAETLRRQGLISQVGSPISVDGRLWGAITVNAKEELPPETEERLQKFTEFVATAIANTESRAELAASDARARELASEQAALRRVATLVAKGAATAEVFAAVAEETGRLLGVGVVNIVRHEVDEMATAVASWSAIGGTIPVGMRLPLVASSIMGRVARTGRPARIDAYAAVPGAVTYVIQGVEIQAGVGVPIVVDARVWGTIVALSTAAKPLAPDAEERLARFTELAATAIANAESRAGLRRLAGEQAALRHVATLVAAGAGADELFAAVAEEVARVLGVRTIMLARFEPEGVITVLASVDEPAFKPGSRWPLDGPSVPLAVRESAAPARIADYTGLTGAIAAGNRDSGIRAAAGVPITVDGAVWGVIRVGVRDDEPLPDDTEERLRDFTALLANAIANAESRDRVRRLAEQQAALRRVATLVADGVPIEVLCQTVVDEVTEVLDVETASVEEAAPAGWLSVVAAHDPNFRAGTRWPLEGSSGSATVIRTGRPAWIDDYTKLPGALAERARRAGLASSLNVPVLVDGIVWGVIGVGMTARQRLALDTEVRLRDFASLLSTAITNAAARERIRRLADEQAALRRVATLVAEGASASRLFSAVAEEVAGVTGIPVVGVHRYETDGTFTAVGTAGDTNFTVGSRWPVEDEGLAGTILVSGRPARKRDYSAMPDPLGAAVRDDRLVSTVGVPIVVDGNIWGFMVARGRPGEPIPAGAEEHLARFTELVATAVSNATMRADLIASRARVVAAGDEARRRIERDLHDGAQQQLVTLALALRSTEGRIPAGLEDLSAEVGRFAGRLTSVIEELREMSRGIHPAILTEGGLSPAVEALALRSAVPVKLDMCCERRLPDGVEAAAYYVVSEALTNAAKHANASRVEIDLHAKEGTLYVAIRDDGVGGADPSGGSGLIGLRDRVEALGGRIDIGSPPGRGTRLDVEIPLPEDPSKGSGSELLSRVERTGLPPQPAKGNPGPRSSPPRSPF